MRRQPPCNLQHGSCRAPLPLQVPNWSSLGRLKRSRFPNLGGGGHQFGGGAGAGALSGAWAACEWATCCLALRGLNLMA